MQAIRQHEELGLRLPLFVKKSNDEGLDFYYLGEVTPVHFEESVLPTGAGGTVPVVKIRFLLDPPVEEAMYTYLTATPATLLP